MKASEICIGDWFKAIDYNSPFRITAIYDDVVQTQADYQSEIDGNWYSEAYIKDLVPIELTEDILVKNGFERCDYNNKYFIIDDVINLITPKWRSGTEYYACAWYQDEFDDLVQHIEICKCAYVHQLQHLLRLCGIEKELTI